MKTQSTTTAAKAMTAKAIKAAAADVAKACKVCKDADAYFKPLKAVHGVADARRIVKAAKAIIADKHDKATDAVKHLDATYFAADAVLRREWQGLARTAEYKAICRFAYAYAAADVMAFVLDNAADVITDADGHAVALARVKVIYKTDKDGRKVMDKDGEPIEDRREWAERAVTKANAVGILQRSLHHLAAQGRKGRGITDGRKGHKVGDVITDATA